MKHMSKFTFSVILVSLSLLAHAQATNPVENAAKRSKIEAKSTDIKIETAKKPLVSKTIDTLLVKKEPYGVRFGIDLIKSTRAFYDTNYKGLELVGDYRVAKNYYLAGELGNENKTTIEDRLNFTTKGTYFKAGFDYNCYENWLDMKNMVYIGLRYGVSSFSQKLNTYEIYNKNPYFTDNTTQISGQKFDGLSAQWLEFVSGMKAEVLHNFYLGFSVRFNMLVANQKPNNFDNLYIPGFGKTYNGDFGASINYSVSYFLPIYKKKVVKKLGN
jgi:hypothetical protein